MTQPEALRLADEFDNGEWISATGQWRKEAAAELRRLHAENNELLKDKARLDWLQKAADALETQAMTPPTLQAAELRRLHAENEKKSEAIQRLWKERDELRDSNEAKADRIDRLGETVEKLKAQRDALLEALQLIADVGDRAATEISRAAIAKVEGKI